ncbi:hypothetical protein GJ633_07695 [Halorubrum sp. CBA1125]|uniref:hypothetical protein n=1 Tax=Halorubrum sp. CBA1125 TaxID=2668072 RepID=UPI0012E826B1|nr:hypothetical protein [Halorubrum sp. CBA1125]MUW14570.1 hypothetical protein [Halorubrum sp. CBA1125]
MHSLPPFPSLPDVTDADAHGDLLEGHLWLLELIDGTGLRFRMDESGLLRFGGPEATYADVDAAPLPLRPAIRHVRERFDREAVRAAVDDPSTVAFFGVATHRRGIDYDWERMPPFLGTDVWAGSTRAFRPPDAAAAIHGGVGLEPVNAIERERNARDFDPAEYAVPESAWYEGPAAGVVVRNKRGGRAVIRGRGAAGESDTSNASDVDSVDATPDPASAATTGGGDASGTEGSTAESLAATHATRSRVERAVETLDRRGEPVEVGALADLVVESVARETAVRFREGNADAETFRAATVRRARAFLDERTEEW